MKAKIKTPIQGYTGLSAGVHFSNGEAEAEISENQYAYFKSAGYEIAVEKDGRRQKTDAKAESGDKKPAEGKGGK